MDYNMDDEHNYSYNYDDYNDTGNEVVMKPKRDNSKLIKYIIFSVLALIFLVGLVILIINIFNKSNDDINLIITETIDLYIGDKRKINVEVKGVKEENPKIIFLSSNESIASVSDDGVVTGISDGSTNIIVTYYDKNDNVYSKNCIVSIMKKNDEPITPPVDKPEPKPDDEPEVDNPSSTPINLKYTIPSSTNGWYKGNVTIRLTYNKSALKNLKYVINCEKNCNYKDITGLNNIVITSEGTSRVTIIATNVNGKTETKTVTIKVDKTKPTVKLNKSNVIEATDKVEVCATCSDSLSGCKEEKVCYTHTQSVNNASLIVSDNAGNTAVSESYKVVIKKNTPKPTCSLSYSNSKIVATIKDNSGTGLSYYGFNSNYTGTSEKEKSNISTGTYTYYIKDKTGNTNTCSLTCSYSGWYQVSVKTVKNCTTITKATAEANEYSYYRICSDTNECGSVGAPCAKQTLYNRDFSCK